MIDISIVTRDFIKLYHQQGARLNDPNQNIESFSGENVKYHELADAYLKYDIIVGKK